jgi:ABC-type phosphate transport system substrate-binding protein
MNKMKLALMAGVAIVGSSAMTESANAQVYSGGSTLASRVYRYMFDCWGTPVSPSPLAINTACGSASGNQSGFGVQILYSPVGSGGGKRALVNHDGSTSSSTGLGVPSSSNTIPYTSTAFPAYGYPTLHFVGSDDPIVSTDLSSYAATTYQGGSAGSLAAAAGNIVQIPSYATPVAIAFNGKDGTGAALNIQNATPTGGSSGLNLSRQALCGIFTGHITQWNNAILTALNGGTALGSGNITVVHRSDGSGTTFITSTALIAQCAGVTGPNSESDSTTVLYNFQWTDNKTANIGNVTTANLCAHNTPIPVEGSDNINWPDLGTDQCGTAIPNPNGAHFASGNGTSGVVSAIQTTNGALGYISPDFALPVNASGPAAANIQSEWDLVTNSGKFEPPTSAGAATAMSEKTPVFDPVNIASNYAWSLQAINGNPVSQGAYPLAGFTWLDFYQCYYNPSEVYPVILNYLQFHYGPTGKAILQNQGFAPISDEWLNFVAYIVTDPTIGMNGGGSGGCASHVGVQ